jgi:hypothetical protein
MPLTESDKVVLTKYPIAPSKCVVCLRSSNGELNFIDFQMSLDIYGSVNICTDCMATVAKGLLGFVEPKDIDALSGQVTNLVEMNRELKTENDKLRSTLDSLFDLRPDLKQRDLPVDEGTDSGSKPNGFDLELDLEL